MTSPGCLGLGCQVLVLRSYIPPFHWRYSRWPHFHVGCILRCRATLPVRHPATLRALQTTGRKRAFVTDLWLLLLFFIKLDLHRKYDLGLMRKGETAKLKIFLLFTSLCFSSSVFWIRAITAWTFKPRPQQSITPPWTLCHVSVPPCSCCVAGWTTNGVKKTNHRF